MAVGHGGGGGNPSTLSLLPSHCYYSLPDDLLTLTLLFDLTVV
jgi:hypothetical protein